MPFLRNSNGIKIHLSVHLRTRLCKYHGYRRSFWIIPTAFIFDVGASKPGIPIPGYISVIADAIDFFVADVFSHAFPYVAT